MSSLASNPDPIDEAALVAGLRDGEELAYERLLHAYGGRLLHVARRFVGEDEAGDVLQEAFLSAFRSIGRFDGRAKLSTWLHRIVVNAALMRLRKRRAKAEEPLEPLLPTFLEDGHRAAPGPAWPEDPEELLRRRETRELVRRAIDRLPVSYRSVVLLRDIEELSGAEAAAMLGTNPNAVKVRLHRARQALRELLDPELREAA